MIRRTLTKKDCDKVLQYKLAVTATGESERILIGSVENVIHRLEGREDAEVFYDETRPFGTYLLEQSSDPKWETTIGLLTKSLELLNGPDFGRLFHDELRPLEDQVQTFLEEKYDSTSPIDQFVAMQIWCRYWRIRGQKDKKKSQQFIDWAQNLVRPLSYPSRPFYSRKRIAAEDPIFRNCKEMEYCDCLNTTYTSRLVPGIECVFIDDSLIPLERFYKGKVEKYKKYIIECKICKKLFIADSLKYELCSENCKKRAVQANAAQREKSPELKQLDMLKSSANTYWNRRLEKMKKTEQYSQKDIQLFQDAMCEFQRNAVEMRKRYKRGEITAKEYQDWIFEQQRKADDLAPDLMVTKR